MRVFTDLHALCWRKAGQVGLRYFIEEGNIVLEVITEYKLKVCRNVYKYYNN